MWPFIEYLCFPYCPFEPQAFSCGHLLNVCIFQIARLSRAFSCGHLLVISVFHISVFHIARLSQAFSFGHLLNISVFHIAPEPGVLLWPFIEYLCIPDCSFEPGVLLWPFIAYLCIPDSSFEPGVLLWSFLNILGKGYLRKPQGHFTWTSL